MFDKMFEEEIDAQEGNLEEKFIIESTGIEYTLDELLFESTEGEIILASAEDQMSDYIKTLAEGGLAQEDIKDHIELLVENGIEALEDSEQNEENAAILTESFSNYIETATSSEFLTEDAMGILKSIVDVEKKMSFKSGPEYSKLAKTLRGLTKQAHDAGISKGNIKSAENGLLPTKLTLAGDQTKNAIKDATKNTVKNAKDTVSSAKDHLVKGAAAIGTAAKAGAATVGHSAAAIAGKTALGGKLVLAAKTAGLTAATGGAALIGATALLAGFGLYKLYKYLHDPKTAHKVSELADKLVGSKQLTAEKAKEIKANVRKFKSSKGKEQKIAFAKVSKDLKQLKALSRAFKK